MEFGDDEPIGDPEFPTYTPEQRLWHIGMALCVLTVMSIIAGGVLFDARKPALPCRPGEREVALDGERWCMIGRRIDP